MLLLRRWMTSARPRALGRIRRRRSASPTKARVRRGHEAQQGHRLIHTLAAHLVQDHPHLLGRNDSAPGEGLDGDHRYFFLTCATCAERLVWPRNVRVGANSPSLWPTMFSVTKMGTWRRPSVRGSAMNPRDHPHGGGEGKAPIGMAGPKTPWGKPTLGYRTRRRKNTNRYIVRRRFEV